MGRSENHDEVLVATETFTCEVDGEVYVVHKGTTRVRADHPLVVANEDRFEPVDLSVSYDVEQATAAPGEKRGEARSSTPPPPPPEDPEPLEGYDELNAKDAAKRLAELSPEQLEAVKAYESTHKNRKGVLEYEAPTETPTE